MIPLRPALIARLYKAIANNRRSDAELLLSQQFSAGHIPSNARIDFFLGQLRNLGIRLQSQKRFGLAEDHFALSLALYDSFAPNSHHEGIATARRLSELYSELGRDDDVAHMLDAAYIIIQRLAQQPDDRAIEYKHHAISELLMRRQAALTATHTEDLDESKVVGLDQPLRVLVVEDNPDDATLVRETLSQSETTFVTEWQEELSAGLQTLSGGGVDLVILDLSLPDSHNLESVSKIKAAAPGTPIIVLTGLDDNQLKNDAIQTGAEQYLVKGKTNRTALMNSVLEAVAQIKEPDAEFHPVAKFMANASTPMFYLNGRRQIECSNAAFKQACGREWTGEFLRICWPEVDDRLADSDYKNHPTELQAVLPNAESKDRIQVKLQIWPYHDSQTSEHGLIAQCTMLNTMGVLEEAPEIRAAADVDDPTERAPVAGRQIGTNARLRQEVAEGKELQDALRRKISQQTVIAAISQFAQAGASLDDLYKLTTKELKDSLNADAAAIFQVTSGMRMELSAAEGDVTTAKGTTIDLQGMAGLESLWQSDAIRRIDQSEMHSNSIFSNIFGIKGSSGVLCNIQLGSETPVGLVAILFKKSHAISDDDEVFFRAMAAILATAISRKQFENNLNALALELKRSNSDLQQFASAAAHDLQEPLRTVVSYLELLENRLPSTLDEKSQKYMHTSISAARRMQVLISDLLEYSRISTKAQAVQRIDANRIVQNAIDDLSVTIKESNAHIEVDQLQTLVADPSQFAQLIQNLLTNALKFRRTDCPLDIKINSTAKDGYNIFSVADNGIGLDMEYAERIFIVFQRLHTRGKYPGTGIGLALCKRIVERHGGQIWVESKPEQGATFRFSWPMIKEKS